MRQTRVLMLFAVLFATAACGETLRSSMAVKLNPRPGVTAENVARQIKLAGRIHGWRIKEIGSRQLEGELEVRGRHYAKVLFEYDEKSYTALYRDSRGLGYNGIRIHWRYHDWLNNIEQGVRREIDDRS